MKKNFNHNPFVVGVTVPINGWRFKNPYFVTDKSGNVFDGSPNGAGFHLLDNTIIEDKDVTHIRLAKAPESNLERVPGGWRIARDFDYFGTYYPVYCGEAYGFVWPDETPAGKVMIPVRLYAYRDKRDPFKTIKLIVAQAKLVDYDPSARYPQISDLNEYVNHPAFWMDPETQVMGHADIVSSIYQIARFKNNLVSYKEANELVALLESMGISAIKYIPGFYHHLIHFLRDKKYFTILLKENPDVFNTANVYLKVKPNNNVMIKLINERRGPETNKVDDPDWEHLSRFLLSPLEYIRPLRALMPLLISASEYKA